MKTSMGTALIGAGVAAAVVMGAMCTYTVKPGYAGVVYNMDGGLENGTLGQGINVVAPWKKVIEYPTSTETVYYTKDDEKQDDDDDANKGDKSINIATKDGKTVNVDVTYTYHMDASHLPDIFTKFRGQKDSMIEAGIMKNAMYQAINEVTSQYDLMALIGDKRPEINAKILEAFKVQLEDDGIIIESFNLSNIRPDEATQAVIQKVVDAQNNLEQAKIAKQTAEVEAEQARVTAKGKADAALIEAEGQAQANAKLQQSLTDSVLRQRAIDKWNGELPKFGGASSFILDSSFLK